MKILLLSYIWVTWSLWFCSIKKKKQLQYRRNMIEWEDFKTLLANLSLYVNKNKKILEKKSCIWYYNILFVFAKTYEISDLKSLWGCFMI